MFLPAIAMLIVAVVFSFLIWLVYRKFWIKIDPKIEKVSSMLSGLNCGACGFTSCQRFAEALIEGDNISCPVMGSGMGAVYKILGREGLTNNAQTAVVLCGAKREDKILYAEYKGIQTCLAGSMYSSYQACSYGCLGFGDCAAVCPVDAIDVTNGVAIVDIDKCISCGLCVKECPRNIIKLVDKTKDFLPLVACSNKDKAAVVRKACSVGCIGCGICVKIGPEGGFLIKDNLAGVDYNKVEQFQEELWKKADEKCPMKTIRIMHIEEKCKK
ncbi:MAG: (Fe-S)-binding protein [Candidatus Saelkia tenebricola]|nr:(Fe-S)-binding protein [Candidatus Saelkia tenebricola]